MRSTTKAIGLNRFRNWCRIISRLFPWIPLIRLGELFDISAIELRAQYTALV